MMPIFFHFESHLWFVLVFLFNGFLLTLCLKRASSYFDRLTNKFEALILSSFFISLGLNGIALLLLGLFDVSFDKLKIGLPVISVVLLSVAFFVVFKLSNFTFSGNLKLALGIHSVSRVLLYVFVFLVLFYNGGMLDSISDAWYHMSLANKIGLENSFFLKHGHLTGIHGRTYPPLWHGNLSLLTIVSEISLPKLWNTATIWVGVLKVMAFYLFSLRLSDNSKVALLSAFLFVMLNGVGDSYLRVSAWPSHIAYTALFTLVYVFFDLLNELKKSTEKGAFLGLWNLYVLAVKHRAGVFACIFIATVIASAHMLELLWFFVALYSYSVILVIFNISTIKSAQIEDRTGYLIFSSIGLFGSLILLLMNGLIVAEDHSWLFELTDHSLITVTTSFVLVTLVIVFFRNLKGRHLSPHFTTKAIWIVTSLLVLFSVDWRNLLSLYLPEYAYPLPRYHEQHIIMSGFFDDELHLPAWRNQLYGLKYSGMICVPLSWLMLVLTPSRLTLFTAACATLSVAVILSPYLYYWLQEITGYYSVWRVSTLIFHPLIIAAASCYFLNSIRSVTARNAKN